jgi:2'-5' RNA ligase
MVRTARVDLTENSSMEDPRATGTSLWLMPEGTVHERLGALIDRLAGRLGTAAFAPHVTLLPGLPGPERDVLETARALAAEMGPVPVRFSVVDGMDHHFRCLFLRARASEALRDAHVRAARRFGREPDPSFDPHLSLVYGTLDTQVKAELTPELSAEAQASFEARRLHVWRTEGPVGEWRALGSFALAPADV